MSIDKNLLLHICCGPCSIMPIMHLKDEGFTVTGYFMNPNIHPLSEYLKRREAAVICANKLGINLIFGDDRWDITLWLRNVFGKDEKPERCSYCCKSRLENTALKALNLGFTYFSSSLLYSKYQPHDEIVSFAKKIEGSEKGNIHFYYYDFRKYWQEGIKISKDWGIYRQAYCGCIYSEAERYEKKLKICKNNI